MNEMDFAAMTLGGHEFDRGEDQIRKNQELANFPFLGINIYSRTTGQQADYCQSSRILEIEGVEIGIPMVAFSPGFVYNTHKHFYRSCFLWTISRNKTGTAPRTILPNGMMSKVSEI